MRGYVLAAGVAAGLLGVSHWQVYRAGRTVAQAGFIQQINQENTHAGKTAEKWRADLRRCNDSGGLFDFATGACDR